MALWLVRTGKHGGHEEKFLETNRVYITWSGLRHDLSTLADKDALKAVLRNAYPDKSEKALGVAAGQIGIVWQEMKPGDWVIVPSKRQPAIHVAEIKSDYAYDANADDPYFHYRDVEWLRQDIPRSSFDQDLLSWFNGLKTIYQIKHDAEPRVRRMVERAPKDSTAPEGGVKPSDVDDGAGDPQIDFEQQARDEIANTIIAKFKGQGMERLVESVLNAQGYTTYASPKGPDKGIDILAAPGPMGFGEPRICVQVKSWEGPADIKVLNELVGAMQNVGAQQALLVAWGGFKSSVDRERAAQFFQTRLWDQNDLIDALLENYDKLDDEIRAELPLRRIWAVAAPEDGE